MPQVLQHIMKRKEPFPSDGGLKRFVDKSIYFVIIFGQAFTIPQIYKVWIEKNVSGLSILTWVAYALYSAFWLAYGIIHKDRPIIFCQAIWLLLYTFVAIGAIIYGGSL